MADIYTADSGPQIAVGKTTSPARRKLSTTAAELQAERDGLLPVYVRAPKAGPEHYTGFTRSYLYALAGEGKIRSVSIREKGRTKGCRLFLLSSILDFVARCEAQASTDKEGVVL
jgi:hypothetical protein